MRPHRPPLNCSRVQAARIQCKKNPAQKKCAQTPHGFTLLELLVAVAIFALIAVAAYRLLTDTVNVRNQSHRQELALQSLQKAALLMQRDFLQTMPRPARDAFGDRQPALFMPHENSIEFTRTGWRNPLQAPRSGLMRVAYRVENEQLIREHWPVLDKARDSQPIKTILLDGVSDFQVQVFADGQWVKSWPLLAANITDAKKVPLPRAVEIRFSVQPWGDIRRVFVLPESDAYALKN